jgi:hypothetical protein
MEYLISFVIFDFQIAALLTELQDIRDQKATVEEQKESSSRLYARQLNEANTAIQVSSA